MNERGGKVNSVKSLTYRECFIDVWGIDAPAIHKIKKV